MDVDKPKEILLKTIGEKQRGKKMFVKEIEDI